VTPTSKNSKNHKRWYYPSSHCLCVNVLLNHITFLWFLLFSMPFLAHVMSITWLFNWHHVVSYKCSIDNNLLSWAVFEILSPKHICVVTSTCRVTWCHLSR